MWADAVPNFLIGLREGLEAGLVVTILLAALRKTAAAQAPEDSQSPEGPQPPVVSTAPIWLGVIGAVALAGSFAAVLTYSTDVLSSTGQEAVGGILSVLAVALVTAMVFWMRRTARTLSGELRGKVEHALRVGTGALALTAFLAVGREGLETTLFLWTAAKTAGDTVAPLIGAGVGLACAAVLCWLLYRRAIKINLGVFFSRTALALIVIAAGVLAYGLGDLQDSGLLPGQQWIAFDLTAHVDPNSWWVTLISGVTELTPKMTVLQVAAWLAFLLVVVPAFLRGDGAPKPAPAKPAAEPTAATATSETSTSEAEVAPARRTPFGAARAACGSAFRQRPWTVASALVLVPVVAAAVTITVLPSSTSSGAKDITVGKKDCAPEFTSVHTGNRVFSVTNNSGKAGEINLDNASGEIVGEIETIGPGTTATLTAALGPGTYTFRCLMGAHGTMTSQTVQASGHSAVQAAAHAVKPVTVKDLTPPNDAYQTYAAGVLHTLSGQIGTIRTDLAHNDLAKARTDWLTAQMTWERVGASYNSFGDAGTAVDGLPNGLRGGVHDKDFTGLHRLEYGLYHGQSAQQLQPVVTALAADVTTIEKNLTSDDIAGDPTNLPLRVHEILEDALRDHLTGDDDEGSGDAYALTYADTQVTRVVLHEVAPLLATRAPKLVATADSQLTGLQQALLATRKDGSWRSPAQTPRAAKERVDSRIGGLLETLSGEPTVLEVPPTH